MLKYVTVHLTYVELSSMLNYGISMKKVAGIENSDENYINGNMTECREVSRHILS
jgi:hypothetical protein